MDEIAKIYIRNLYGLYRIKIFENSIGMERQQPYPESNLLFEHSKYPKLYEGDGIWNIDSINILIDHYEAEIAAMNVEAEMLDSLKHQPPPTTGIYRKPENED